MKHIAMTIVNEALPYAAGAACISISWTLLGWGAGPLLSALAGMALLAILIMARVHQVLREVERAAILEDLTLPIKVARDTDEATDEVPLGWNTIDTSVTEEILKEDTVPDIVHIAVFVDDMQIRTMRFPRGRRILDNEADMLRHTRKYSDVAQALRGKTILLAEYLSHDSVWFTIHNTE